MKGVDIKSYRDRSGLIVKADVRRFINDEKISDFIIIIGSKLIVKPMNMQKLRHRDRRVEVLSFNFSDEYGPRANVRFLDNNRRGIIDIRDLDTLE